MIDLACRTFRVHRACLILLLLAVGPNSSVHASDGFERAEAASALETGNRLYQQGDYRGALDAYDAALATGYASAALYHNMGNAYFRLDQLGQAIRHYEKARRLRPDDPMLLHNLDIARSRTTGHLTSLPEPYWTRWWRALTDTAGIAVLFWAGLLLYLAAAVLAGYRILTGVRTPWLRRVLTAAACGAIILLGTAYTASVSTRSSSEAVLVVDQAPLLSAPQCGAPAEAALHEGTLLIVEDERGDWLRVRLPNGTAGWVEAQATGAI